MKIFSGGTSLWSGSTITVMVCLKRSQCCGIRNLRGRRSIAYVTDTLNLLYIQMVKTILGPATQASVRKGGRRKFGCKTACKGEERRDSLDLK